MLSEAERDLAVLADTDLDIEPLFAYDPDVDPPLDTSHGKMRRGEVELAVVAAAEKQIAFLQAMQMRALARFAALRPGEHGKDYSDFVADEIGLTVCWTTAYAGSRLALAFALTDRLPATLAALARGDIDIRRAQRLAEITAAAPPSVARAVEDAVLPDAVEQNSAELARAARKTLLQLDPDGAAERHQERKKDRRVELNQLDDAMAELRAYLTAPEADRIYHTINTYAQAAHTPGDTRTADQRRADTFCDFILGPDHRPTVTGSTSAGDTTDTGDAASADGTSADGTSPGASTDDTDPADPANTGTNRMDSTGDRDAATTTTTTTGGTAGTGETDVTGPSANGATGNGGGSADDTDGGYADTTRPDADAHDTNAGSVSTSGTGDAGTTTDGTGACSTGSAPGAGSGRGGATGTSTGNADSAGSDTTSTGATDTTPSTRSSTKGTTGGTGDAATTGAETTTQAGSETAAGRKSAPRGGSATGTGPTARVGRPAAQAHVTVPLTTLLGLDNQPGDLAGHGPIPADLARELAADGVWRRLITDPLSGSLLDYGRTTYRPPAALADFVRARDRRCVFPGCGRKATCCDLDHTICYPDGPTSACNLTCLCRHHHRLKHESDWTLHRDGDQFIWTAPTGLQYVRKPEPLTPPAPPPPSPPPGDEQPPF